MQQLFLAAELANLMLAESDEEFQTLECFRQLVRAGLISPDHVIIVSSNVADGCCENIEVTGLRWSRLRRHDFYSYVDNLHRELITQVEKSQGDFSGGVQGAQPRCPKQVGSEASPQKPILCCSDKCQEDGVCRRQGVDLISPCTSDTSLER